MAGWRPVQRTWNRTFDAREERPCPGLNEGVFHGSGEGGGVEGARSESVVGFGRRGGDSAMRASPCFRSPAPFGVRKSPSFLSLSESKLVTRRARRPVGSVAGFLSLSTKASIL